MNSISTKCGICGGFPTRCSCYNHWTPAPTPAEQIKINQRVRLEKLQYQYETGTGEWSFFGRYGLFNKITRVITVILGALFVLSSLAFLGYVFAEAIINH